MEEKYVDLPKEEVIENDGKAKARRQKRRKRSLIKFALSKLSSSPTVLLIERV